jgi:peptidoglycan/xylan/chitin deacetylase (PgdA/CDA1 family)
MYHRVGTAASRFCVAPEALEQQLAWLAGRGEAPLPLREALLAGARRGVVLTFDDGTRDTFALAWPALRRQGLTATVFLITHFMGGEMPGESGPVPMLDWGQAREMSQAGVEFGSHTATHLDLRHAEIGAIREELRRSKAAIEGQLGTEVVSFAYPFGYFREGLPELLAEAGYRWAVLGATYGSNTSATRPFELRRIPVDGDASLGVWRANLGARGQWRYYAEKIRREMLWRRRRGGAEQQDGR